MKQVFRSGLSQFNLSSRKGAFVFTGNMNSTYKSIQESFESMFAPGAWQEFVKIANIKHDDPKYLYHAEITVKQYREHLAHYRAEK